ncbi:hypothetical protein STEG23_014270, partial [Scotinomys teguina]
MSSDVTSVRQYMVLENCRAETMCHTMVEDGMVVMVVAAAAVLTVKDGADKMIIPSHWGPSSALKNCSSTPVNMMLYDFVQQSGELDLTEVNGLSPGANQYVAEPESKASYYPYIASFLSFTVLDYDLVFRSNLFLVLFNSFPTKLSFSHISKILSTGVETRDKSLESSGQSLEPSGQNLEPSGHSLGPSGQSLEPSGQSLEPSGQSLGPSGQSLEPSGQSLGPSGQSLEPSGQSLGPSGQSLESSGQSLEPSGQSLGPSRQSLESSGQSLEPSGHSLGPSGHSLGPSGQSLGPSGQSLGPSGQSLEPSGQSLEPSGQSLGPSGQSLVWGGWG